MSELRADTITGSDGTSPVTLTKQSAAKAYANFSSTAIVKSLNYSSFLDNGIGDHSLTVTSALSDINYTYGGFARSTTASAFNRGATVDGEDPTTTKQRYQCCAHANSGAEDIEAGFTVIHGDLA